MATTAAKSGASENAESTIAAKSAKPTLVAAAGAGATSVPTTTRMTKAAKAARAVRPAKTDKADKAARAVGPAKTDKADKAAHTIGPANADKAAQAPASALTEKPAGTAAKPQQAKTGQPVGADAAATNRPLASAAQETAADDAARVSDEDSAAFSALASDPAFNAFASYAAALESARAQRPQRAKSSGARTLVRRSSKIKAAAASKAGNPDGVSQAAQPGHGQAVGRQALPDAPSGNAATAAQSGAQAATPPAADGPSASEGFSELLDKLSGKLRRHYGRTLQDASKKQLLNAISLMVRDDIMEKWTISKEDAENKREKQLYYLSLEFLMGRALGNNIINLTKSDDYSRVCDYLGVSLDEILDAENDAGLGNGGLGRLAACFLDSLTTLGLNASGCGIRYQYGLFKQKIMDGYQIELPDPWLEDGNIWEVPCPDEQVEVRFGGTITENWNDGVTEIEHTGYETVIAVPYDIPICGYSSKVVNRLRLWSARAPQQIDMALFNSGDYVSAAKEKELAEVLSKVLYPEDNHYTGKTLRLRQQYFFVSATIQWIVRDYKRVHGTNFFRLPDFVAIHINDTHPALAIPELLRILVDEERLHWVDAFEIVSKVFSYTNHTIMSEALERWPAAFFQQNLPRIHMIVHEINETYCRGLWEKHPGDWDRIAGMAVIADGEVRMANLCVAMSANVNGVSALHTDILKGSVFHEYYKDDPNKFVNVTNGVTHRRWLLHANPGLARLVTSAIGPEWILNPDRLSSLARFADDAGFQESFSQARAQAKRRLSDYIQTTSGVLVDPNAIFDVQIKRLHEYKRQLLNIVHILAMYRATKMRARGESRNGILPGWPGWPGVEPAQRPIVFFFGAKASPGYHRARMIIKLITSVSQFIARDPDVRDLIKVVFVENYGVSIAEKIIPAADISEQISTAGMEASGTGNMKLMLNGAVTIGTLDGSNVEMRELVGDDNIYIFGLTSDETRSVYDAGSYGGRQVYDADNALAAAIDMIQDGTLSQDKPRLFSDIVNSLLYNESGMSDRFLVLKDFRSYAGTHARMISDSMDNRPWTRKGIINVSAAGHFSSDRSTREYNELVWRLK